MTDGRALWVIEWTHNRAVGRSRPFSSYQGALGEALLRKQGGWEDIVVRRFDEIVSGPYEGILVDHRPPSRYE